MSKIAIITDTDSSLPDEVAARYGIRQVPINIHFGEETFASGVDIDDTELFARIDRENKLPTTSAPTPGQFSEAYRAAFDEGAEAILCFCVSGEISATAKSAITARDFFEGRAIEVVDSRTLSMGQGFMVMAAAEAIQEGATITEAIRRAMAIRERTSVYAALATLKYLAMSGRVGQLAAGMAQLLSIKPILRVSEGKLDMLEKVRTQRKAWGRVIELTNGALGGASPERLAIVHSNAPDAAQAFLAALRAGIPCPEDTIITDFSPGLSVHAGAGVVGAVAVVPE